jgi:hypothetical protein
VTIEDPRKGDAANVKPLGELSHRHASVLAANGILEHAPRVHRIEHLAHKLSDPIGRLSYIGKGKAIIVRTELPYMDIVIPNPTSIGIFSVAAILLLLTPGPAVLYIVARSVEQGRIAGLASVCGIITGTLVHVLAAALGLSALLASSALAFAVVKYAGAGYLIYTGARRILSWPDTPAAQIELPRRSLRRLYRDGFVVNLLNPKTALFFCNRSIFHTLPRWGIA